MNVPSFPSKLSFSPMARMLSVCFAAFALFAAPASRAASVPTAKTKAQNKVSYHGQIWPIVQAKCQGCHQPAFNGGKLVVTTYKDFLKGGEHGAAWTSGKPQTSLLMDYLTGKRTLMPKGGPALSAPEIALFRQWIAQGAKDDTPVTKDLIDAEHPPVYTAPPVTTALAYAPDGKTLAISGYREILLYNADGSGLAARLVGNAHVIESLDFTPDGSLLCAVGGAPARFGEIQFWNPATHKLTNAVQTTFDTIFGASLSPDGKNLAFGGADNSVRVVSVPDGKQTMRLDNHSDWVFATAFALDPKTHALNVLSAGRDQAIKLTLVEGGSFIDDINTHYTNLRCLVRNPKADTVLCGGDDGLPRLYKIFRTEARTMNQEDHNLLQTFAKQPGPITALAFSPDGTLIAVGSEAGVTNLYNTADGKAVATLKGQTGVVYAAAFRPDGKQIAVGGFDGTVRLYDLPSGKIVKAFVPVPIQKASGKKESKPLAGR